MWQMVFAHISVEAWIICSYVHGFFYCSLKVVALFPHYGEIFQFDIVTSGGIMVKNWGWSLLVFFEPFIEISGRLTNVLFITLHPITCIFIYDTTSFEYGIRMFWWHQEALDGDSSFKMNMYSMFTASSFDTLTMSKT